MNQANIVNYKVLVLPIDIIAQYFSSHANSCLQEKLESGVSTWALVQKCSRALVHVEARSVL